MKKIDAGYYEGTLGRSLVRRETSGAWMFYVHVDLDNGMSDNCAICIVSKAGELQQKSLNSLHEVIHDVWPDKSDAAALEQVDCTGIRVTAVVEDDDRNPQYSRIRYINPIGGRKTDFLPEKKSGESLAKQFGSKFRAVFKATATPAQPATPAAGAPSAPAKPAKPAAPAAPAVDCKKLANDAWLALNTKMDGKPDTDITAAWFEMLKKCAGTDDQTKVSAEQWSAIMAEIGAGGEDGMPF